MDMVALLLSALALTSFGAADTALIDLAKCHYVVTHPRTESMRPSLAFSAFTTCLDLVSEARRQDVAPFFVLSMAYKESRWQYGRVGAAGEVGPLQILPNYWCPKGCSERQERVVHGVRAVKVMLKRAERKLKRSRLHRQSSRFQEFQEFLAACHFKGGNECGSQANASASLVGRRTVAFRGNWNQAQARP